MPTAVVRGVQLAMGLQLTNKGLRAVWFTDSQVRFSALPLTVCCPDQVCLHKSKCHQLLLRCGHFKTELQHLQHRIAGAGVP